MAGARISVNIEGKATRDALARVQRFLERPRPLLRELGEYLRASTQDRFRSQIAPDGAAWAPLSPRYLERKRRNADKILTLRGYLRSQITYQLDGDDAVLVGSNRAYAAIHQFGGEIDIAARSQQVYFHRNPRTNAVGRLFVKKRRSNFSQWATIGAHKIRIPARPYLGISEEDRTEIVERTQRFIADLLAPR